MSTGKWIMTHADTGLPFILLEKSDTEAFINALTNKVKGLAPEVGTYIKNRKDHMLNKAMPVLKNKKKVGSVKGSDQSKWTEDDKLLKQFDAGTKLETTGGNFTDGEFFYKLTIKQEYIGNEQAFEQDYKRAHEEKDRYYKRDMPAVFSFIVEHLHPLLLKKINVLPGVFDKLSEDNDIIGLIDLIRTVQLSGGAADVSQFIVKMANMRFRDYNEDTTIYFNAWNELVIKLDRAVQSLPTGTDFRTLLINVLFQHSLLECENPYIAMKVNMYTSQGKTVEIDVLQQEIITNLRQLESMKHASDVGVAVTANTATSSLTSKATRSTSGRAPAKTVCWNCDRPGHKVGDCRVKQSYCPECKTLGHLPKYCHKIKNTASDSPSSLLANRKSNMTNSKFKKKIIKSNMTDVEEEASIADDEEQVQDCRALAILSKEDAVDPQVEEYAAYQSYMQSQQDDDQWEDEDDDHHGDYKANIITLHGDEDNDSMPDLVSDHSSDDEYDDLPSLVPDYDSDDETEVLPDLLTTNHPDLEFYDLPDLVPIFATMESEDDEDEPSMLVITSNTITLNGDIGEDTSIVIDESNCTDTNDETVTSYYSPQQTDISSSVPIYATIDTGSKANLIKEQFIAHPVFKNTKESNGITVSGIDATTTPIPVTHTAIHPILGRVLFGKFSCNLIGIPELLNKGLELHCYGDRMEITKSSNKKVLYVGVKNKHGLFSCDININSNQIESYNTVVTSLSSDLVSPGIKVNMPMHINEQERAREARDLHERLGHPSNDVLKAALNNHVYPGINLSSKDVDNME
jgi:hypothetical protein